MKPAWEQAVPWTGSTLGASLCQHTHTHAHTPTEEILKAGHTFVYVNTSVVTL